MTITLGLMGVLFGMYCTWQLYKALANKEITLPARGKGTYWLRQSEKPVKFLIFALTFILAILMSFGAGTLLLLGCDTLTSSSCLLR